LNEPLENIRNIIIQATRLTQNGWSETINRISNDTITLLEFCSDQLDVQKLEPPLNPKELSDLKEEIRTVRQHARVKNYPEDLKAAVIELLNKIEFGINQYETFGINAFYKVFKDVFFFSYDNKEILEKLKIDEDGPKVMKIVETFNKMVAFVKSVGSVKAALPVAAQYLLPK
jgi:hypothetical protein